MAIRLIWLVYRSIIEKKSMGDESSFWLLVRPHRLCFLDRRIWPSPLISSVHCLCREDTDTVYCVLQCRVWGPMCTPYVTLNAPLCVTHRLRPLKKWSNTIIWSCHLVATLESSFSFFSRHTNWNWTIQFAIKFCQGMVEFVYQSTCIGPLKTQRLMGEGPRLPRNKQGL